MSFVVTEACINCKYTDCVEVCPVDCFYEGPNMVVINPEECIDCGLCEPACPISAILSEDELNVEQKHSVLEMNLQYAKIWPQISTKKEPLAQADEWKAITNKIDFLER